LISIVLFNVIEKKNAVNFTEQSKEPHLQKNSPLRAAIAVSWNERLQPTQKAFTIAQAGRMTQSAVLPFSLPGELLGRKLFAIAISQVN